MKALKMAVLVLVIFCGLVSTVLAEGPEIAECWVQGLTPGVTQTITSGILVGDVVVDSTPIYSGTNIGNVTILNGEPQVVFAEWGGNVYQANCTDLVKFVLSEREGGCGTGIGCTNGVRLNYFDGMGYQTHVFTEVIDYEAEVSFPSEVVVGQAMTATIVVRNLGDPVGITTEGFVYLGFLTQDDFVVPMLAHNQVFTHTYGHVFTQTGTYYLGADADSSELLDEISEGNNYQTVTVVVTNTITPPPVVTKEPCTNKETAFADPIWVPVGGTFNVPEDCWIALGNQVITSTTTVDLNEWQDSWSYISTLRANNQVLLPWGGWLFPPNWAGKISFSWTVEELQKGKTTVKVATVNADGTVFIEYLSKNDIHTVYAPLIMR